jgi:putative membrane protein
MPGILIRWIVTTLAVLVVPHVISGVHVQGLGTALAAGAILGILNAIVRPVLILLTLPLTIVSIGFFIFVINALLFELAAAVVPGMQVDSFWSALFASIVVSIVSWILNSAVRGGPNDVEPTVIIRSGRSTVDMHRSRDGKWE